MPYYQVVKAKIHFNITLSIYPCLQNGLFPSRFFTKIFQVYLLSHVHLYMTAKRHLQSCLCFTMAAAEARRPNTNNDGTIYTTNSI